MNNFGYAQASDIGDAVRIGDATLSRSDLVGAAMSVAERVAAADRVAVLATPTPVTVLAIGTNESAGWAAQADRGVIGQLHGASRGSSP